MAICVLKADHPIRVQFSPGLVVHAAREGKYGGFDRYIHSGCGKPSRMEHVPEITRIYIACRYRTVQKEHIVASNSIITCKQCAKMLGFDKIKSSPKRFVVINNETEEYYKSDSRCTSWVEDILDATLYKIKGVAENKTVERFFYDAEGNRLNRSDFYKYDNITRAEKGMVSRREKSSKYDVKTVTITVD